MKCDEDSEAETEDEDGDKEVAVGEDGFGALGFVHGVTSGSGFIIDQPCEGERGFIHTDAAPSIPQTSPV